MMQRFCFGIVYLNGSDYRDVRSDAKISEFVETHSDDVTRVQFHPTRPELLMSGSTDGYQTIPF
jgi:SEL1 protein